MPLQIDNSRYARSNVLFGRVLPAVVTICAIWLLASLLSHGLTRGTAVPAMLAGLCIVYMIVTYVRRGRHPAVTSIEFLPDRIDVHCLGGMSSVDMARVRDMEYEGIENRSRVQVLNAPFPTDAERILVITLDDGTEFRVRVRDEHDAPLKEIAARQQRSPSVGDLSGQVP